MLAQIYYTFVFYYSDLAVISSGKKKLKYKGI